MTRKVVAFGLVGLMLTVLGCANPFDEPNDTLPFDPAQTMACCEGYTQAKLTALVGAPTEEAADDEIDLYEDGFRVRVEATAVSRGVRPGPAKTAGLGSKYYQPKEPDAEHELLSALLSVTAVKPVRHKAYDYFYWYANATVVAIDDPTLAYAGLKLVEWEDKEPTGSTTVVVMAVVPIGSTVILCAEADDDDRPWLNLRTGRLQPKPKGAHGCAQRYYGSATPRSSKPVR